MMKVTAILALASLALAGCDQVDRCASASNPAECQAWGDAGGDIDDYLTGAMVGYMLANRGGQTVIIRDPGYHGSYRPLRRPLMSESAQVRSLKAKVERQRAELRRQQQANARKNAEMRAMKSSSWKPSGSSYKSTFSYRPSTRSYRAK
jgi:hypothetical protein